MTGSLPPAYVHGCGKPRWPLSPLPGDKVTAGTVNCDGALTVRAEHSGQQTVIADIVRMVEMAQVGAGGSALCAVRVWVPMRMVEMAQVGAGVGVDACCCGKPSLTLLSIHPLETHFCAPALPTRLTLPMPADG